MIASQKWRAKNLDKARAADRVRRKAYYEANRVLVRAANEDWRRRNPEKFKAAWTRRNAVTGRTYRLRKYGLSTAEWDAIFESQGRSCALCGRTTPGGRRGWVTDHDHSGGAVRGILCHGCNTGLGLLGDSAEAIRTALAYLLRARSTPRDA